jgi:hypothetical protein
MTTKPRDPADATLIQNFHRKTRPQAGRVSFPKSSLGAFLCNGVAGGPAALWMRETSLVGGDSWCGQSIDHRMALSNFCPVKSRRRLARGGWSLLSKRSCGATRPVSASQRIRPAGLMHTTGGEASRSGVYRAQDAAISMAGVFEEGLSIQSSGMSLAENQTLSTEMGSCQQGLPPSDPQISENSRRKAKLPDRHCQNPECLKEIDEDSHHKRPVL